MERKGKTGRHKRKGSQGKSDSEEEKKCFSNSIISRIILVKSEPGDEGK